MRRTAFVWLLVWVAWTALAVIFAVGTSLTYISQDRAPLWGLSIAFALTQWWIWAALTPVVLWLARRFPVVHGRIGRRMLLHLALGLVVAYVKVTVEGWARGWLFGATPYLVINNLLLQVLIYGALVLGAHALDRYGRTQARAAEAEARLGEAKLQLLRAQLQPHFLFNALNAIAELVHENPERADQMIGRLSDLLRAALDSGGRPEVPLDEEAGLLERYLDLQRVRFGDRLRASIDIPAECGAAMVPHFLLQPLVENAVVHGISPRAGGGRIDITASRRGSRLTIAVDDDGVGWKDGPVDGVGLANTRGRLESMFGSAATLTMIRRPEGGVRSVIELPFSTKPWNGDAA